MIHILYY